MTAPDYDPTGEHRQFVPGNLGELYIAFGSTEQYGSIWELRALNPQATANSYNGPLVCLVNFGSEPPYLVDLGSDAWYLGVIGPAVPPPLRHGQRNDGLATAGHPRLGAGHGPTSAQYTVAPRVGQANTYL